MCTCLNRRHGTLEFPIGYNFGLANPLKVSEMLIGGSHCVFIVGCDNILRRSIEFGVHRNRNIDRSIDFTKKILRDIISSIRRRFEFFIIL